MSYSWLWTSRRGWGRTGVRTPKGTEPTVLGALGGREPSERGRRAALCDRSHRCDRRSVSEELESSILQSGGTHRGDISSLSTRIRRSGQGGATASHTTPPRTGHPMHPGGWHLGRRISSIHPAEIHLRWPWDGALREPPASKTAVGWPHSRSRDPGVLATLACAVAGTHVASECAETREMGPPRDHPAVCHGFGEEECFVSFVPRPHEIRTPRETSGPGPDLCGCGMFSFPLSAGNPARGFWGHMVDSSSGQPTTPPLPPRLPVEQQQQGHFSLVWQPHPCPISFPLLPPPNLGPKIRHASPGRRPLRTPFSTTQVAWGAMVSSCACHTATIIEDKDIELHHLCSHEDQHTTQVSQVRNCAPTDAHEINSRVYVVKVNDIRGNLTLHSEQSYTLSQVCVCI